MPRDETMAHESEGHKYRARVLVCHACRERDLKAKEHTRGEHDDAGLMFAVEPID